MLTPPSAAFSRNIGILTVEEQQRLGHSTVAIAGLGGVGGSVLILLARMGVGRFRLADFDRFEEVNINRQYGSSTTTVGEPKVDVLAREVRAINPSVEVTSFSEGFTAQNGDEVLNEADIVVDAVDFYAIESHLAVHSAARRHGLYTIVGSAVGFSACLQVFDPNGMTIEEYCDIRGGMLPLEKQLRYACSIVPELLHVNYFDVSRGESNTDFMKSTGPSLSVACSLAASLVAGEVALILLKRRPPRCVPYTFQFDPYTWRYAQTYIEGGMRNFDPSAAIARIQDKSSFVPRVLDMLYLAGKRARAKVEGAELAYRVEGEGDPLLLLSPLGADASFWLRQVSALASAHKVITFGHRGAPSSSPTDETCSIEQMAKDALGLLDQLGTLKADLVGLAVGSLVAQHIAHLAPERVGRLVLAASYIQADQSIAEITEHWRQTARRQGMEVLFDLCLEWLFTPVYLKEHTDEVNKLRAVYRLVQQDVTSFCGQSLAGLRHDSRGWISHIVHPTLVLHGTADRLVSFHHAKALNEAIPGAQLALIEGAPHFLNWEYPDKFNRAIENFLS
jgi:pimeloyl-ACP methyl ester carboxylesterase/molybdopterin/thiamine biosynthesis adenylyltransferase